METPLGGPFARAEAALRRLNYCAAVLAGGLLLLVIAVVLCEMVMRYAFNAPTIWAYDVARFLLVYVVFLGLPLTLQEGGHVAVDLVVHAVGSRARWWLLLGARLMTVAFGLVLTWQITLHTVDAFAEDWVSPSILAVPLKYVYAVAPLGSALFTLTALDLLLRHVRRLDGEPPPSAPGEVEA